jgi:lysophospholipase L1-like esterase
MGRTAQRCACLILCTAAAGAAPDPAAATAPPALFTWSVPPGFGQERGPHGELLEAKPDAVTGGPFAVVLTVTPTWCAGGGSYRWAVDGAPLAVAPGPSSCTYLAELPKEGDYGVALHATVGGRPLAQRQTVHVQDWLIVSIGDSVASGESVPDVPGLRHSIWQDERCHRSARAGPDKAAQQIEDDDSQSSVTFVHVACSGATIAHGLTGTYGGVLTTKYAEPLPAQVDAVVALAKVRRIDALLISVGANDVHFGDIVRACATRITAHCFDTPVAAGSPQTIDAALHDALDALPDAYAKLADALRGAVDPADVHITTYFDPTRDARGATCRTSIGDISATELGLAQSAVLAPLNRAVIAAAHAHGWEAITGIDTLFAHHGYCAGRDSWVTTLPQSIAHLGGRLQGRLLGTLHPNEAGQSAIGSAIGAQLEQRLYPGRSLIVRAAAATTRPPSDDDDGPDGWLAGLTLAGVAVGVAAAAVAWLLLRRRRATM